MSLVPLGHQKLCMRRKHDAADRAAMTSVASYLVASVARLACLVCFVCSVCALCAQCSWCARCARVSWCAWRAFQSLTCPGPLARKIVAVLGTYICGLPFSGVLSPTQTPRVGYAYVFVVKTSGVQQTCTSICICVILCGSCVPCAAGTSKAVYAKEARRR